jgi:hypothetical protein
VNAATSSNTPNTIVKRDETGGFSTGTITGTLSGTASNANALTTSRTIETTGDVTSSGSFDGTSNLSLATTLANSGVSSGTYGTSTSVPIITVDSKGRITSATTTNIPTATITVTGLLSSADYENIIYKLDDVSADIGIEIMPTEIVSIGQIPRRGITIKATDADSQDKGIILLAGDLTGTADLPRINTVGGVLSSTITTVASSVLSATANNTASTLVQRDGSGGFAAGAVTATSVVSSGNISSTSLNTGTLKVTGGTPTTVGYVLTASNTDGTVTWSSASGGITGVGTITTTSYPNGATVSSNNLVLAAANGTNGGVLTSETQTIGGQKSFANAVTNLAASGFSTNIINFSASNLAYTTLSPTAFSLQNMKDGGTYTLAVQGTTSGTSTFSGTNPSGTNFTFISMGGNTATVQDKQTLYTFIVMGTTVYYSLTSQN